MDISLETALNSVIAAAEKALMSKQDHITIDKCIQVLKKSFIEDKKVKELEECRKTS